MGATGDAGPAGPAGQDGAVDGYSREAKLYLVNNGSYQLVAACQAAPDLLTTGGGLQLGNPAAATMVRITASYPGDSSWFVNVTVSGIPDGQPNIALQVWAVCARL